MIKNHVDATARTRVVIIGGGFGGLEVAKGLRRSHCDVTLIDRNNYHLFQPLLYQVGTGGLSPANIATPLRAIVGKHKNCDFLLGEVVDVNLQEGFVQLADERVPFDSLVVAAGSSHNYFGNPQWQQFAPGLKSLQDATEVRSRIFSAFEAADRASDPVVRKMLMTFVVVGGGPTGVELARALSEIARHTLRHDFRRIAPEESHIVLLEAGERVLDQYPSELCDVARHDLERLGVDVRLRTRVTRISEDEVRIAFEGGEQSIAARTVIWAAGVKANPLGKMIAQSAGVALDRTGRLEVNDQLSLSGFDNLYVIGDMAACRDASGGMLPGVAPVAIQQGKYVAKCIANKQRHRPPPRPFRYRDFGSMATIGRAAAIAKVGRFQFSGVFAWLLWLGVHLVQIMEFPNRLLILIQWAWNYLTFNRAARLITGNRHRMAGSGRDGEFASGGASSGEGASAGEEGSTGVGGAGQSGVEGRSETTAELADVR